MAPDWEKYAQNQPINADSYAREPVQAERVDKIIDRSVGSVLDVGGGDGHISRRLMDDGHQVTMTETSRLRCDRAKAQGVDARLKDSLRWFGDGAYDTVVIGEVLEHLTDPGYLLRDAFNIARQRVILTVPLNGWPDPTHQWRISLDHLSSPSPHADGRYSPQEQIVLTWHRGSCWPQDYHLTDEAWKRQFEEGR